jgi:hypothetical protein
MEIFVYTSVYMKKEYDNVILDIIQGPMTFPVYNRV